MSKPKTYKPFCKEAYERNVWVEELVMSKILIPSHSLRKNPDNYGIDILIVNHKGEIVGGLEAEKHGKYWRAEFPFQTVHFLGRKTKYAEADYFYVMTNSNGEDCCMIEFWKLLQFPMIRLNTPECDEELFFEVPVEDCIWGWPAANQQLTEIFCPGTPKETIQSNRLEDFM